MQKQQANLHSEALALQGHYELADYPIGGANVYVQTAAKARKLVYGQHVKQQAG